MMDLRRHAMSSILLIEDDKTIRLALGFTLANEGYELTVATDGAQGLEAARATDPDLILLDVMLPKLSGLEVARQLRNDGSKVPIIMLTALDQETDKVAGLDAGADDYVTKPFSMAELLARVRANMRRRMESKTERPSQIDVGELYMDLNAARVLVAGNSVRLRKKEYQLLFALASRPGTLCTRQ
jgi:DNA-binding response OmpR family regulator